MAAFDRLMIEPMDVFTHYFNTYINLTYVEVNNDKMWGLKNGLFTLNHATIFLW